MNAQTLTKAGIVDYIYEKTGPNKTAPRSRNWWKPLWTS